MKKGKLRKLFTCIDVKYILMAKRINGQEKGIIALKIWFLSNQKNIACKN